MVAAAASIVGLDSAALHQPLNVLDESIRVLQILPSRQPKAPIKCRLLVVSLTAKSAPKFDALSYVWASPAPPDKVIVNGRELEVTESLNSALHRVRRRLCSRFVWVDQICINQNDLKEKSTQILLMGKIYSRAERVLSWLGDSDRTWSMEFACHWLTGLHRNRSLFWLYLTQPTWTVRSILRRLVYIAECSLPSESAWTRARLREFQTIGRASRILEDELDDHPYWTRMWILQEFALAEAAPLLMYGKLSLGKNFMDATLWGMITGLSEKALIPCKRILEKPTRTPRPELVAELEEAAEALEARAKAPYEIGCSRHLAIRNRRQNENCTMSWCLITTYAMHCTNPRDKVYALYSMVQEDYSLPKPDYESPLEVILQRVVARTVMVDQSLAIFEWVAPSSNQLHASWIPVCNDMGQCTEAWKYSYLRKTLFEDPDSSASGSLPVLVDFESDQEIMVVNGFEVDHISHIFNVPGKSGGEALMGMAWDCGKAAKRVRSSASSDDKERFNKLLAMAQKPSKLSSLLEELMDLVNLLEPNNDLNTRNPVHGINDDGSMNDSATELPAKEKTATIYDLLKKYHTHKATDGALENRARILLGRVDELINCTLFITTKGFVGLVNRDFEPRSGDLVSVLGGLDCPYVLRRRGVGYAMIGPAFVSGVMEGEIVDLNMNARERKEAQVFKIV